MAYPERVQLWRPAVAAGHTAAAAAAGIADADADTAVFPSLQRWEVGLWVDSRQKCTCTLMDHSVRLPGSAAPISR